MKRTLGTLKEGDQILVKGVAGVCTFGTVLNRVDARWGSIVRCLVITPSEGIQEIFCDRITHILGIDDGYSEHLVFNDDNYWIFK